MSARGAGALAGRELCAFFFALEALAVGCGCALRFAGRTILGLFGGARILGLLPVAASYIFVAGLLGALVARGGWVFLLAAAP